MFCQQLAYNYCEDIEAIIITTELYYAVICYCVVMYYHVGLQEL